MAIESEWSGFINSLTYTDVNLIGAIVRIIYIQINLESYCYSPIYCFTSFLSHIDLWPTFPAAETAKWALLNGLTVTPTGRGYNMLRPVGSVNYCKTGFCIRPLSGAYLSVRPLGGATGKTMFR